MKHEFPAPPRVRAVIEETAREHRVGVEELLGPRKTSRIVEARWHAIARIRALDSRYSTPLIGGWLNRDHTSIVHALQRTSEHAR